MSVSGAGPAYPRTIEASVQTTAEWPIEKKVNRIAILSRGIFNLENIESVTFLQTAKEITAMDHMGCYIRNLPRLLTLYIRLTYVGGITRDIEYSKLMTGYHRHIRDEIQDSNYANENARAEDYRTIQQVLLK